MNVELNTHQKVSASFTDFKTNLSVIGAFRIIEDAITEFMGDLKIDGLTAKREYNAVWVFAKTKVEFLKNIEWGDDCAVTCFISKISNVTIYIDVALKNTQGELCVYSRTELCALDTSTGRIRKVSTVGVTDQMKAEAPLIDMAFNKIDAENLPAVGKVKVGFTSLDYIVHTNNKEYVRFIMDAYSYNEMKNCRVREMEIIYVNQSYETDELTVHRGSEGEKDIFAIEKDGKIIAKSSILRTAD